MPKADDLKLIHGDHLLSEITPLAAIEDRRRFMKTGVSSAALAGFAALGVTAAQASSVKNLFAGKSVPVSPLTSSASKFSIMDKPAAAADATSYNNYYEFGLDKDQPALLAPRSLNVQPWQVAVEGLVNRPQVFDLDDLKKLAPMEERVYRMRCVEGWSMVIPWIGYSLSELIKRVQPQGSAKFVEFVTLADRAQMPGLSSRVLRWPYHEGLRLDEAQHPLTLLGFGMYGYTLPAQNGAPVRMVVPWKYGFKSIKSIVSIRFVEAQPTTSWGLSAPHEYGFYSNVNPDVPHPRWSQASERVLGQGNALFAPRRKTDRFNGYEPLVGQLYAGMDLKRFY